MNNKKPNWLRASAFLGAAISLGLTVTCLGSENVQATSQKVKTPNPHSTVIHHYGKDKANRQLVYDDGVVVTSAATLPFSAASSGASSSSSPLAGIATGHIASYLGIVNSQDYNAVATASNAASYPYNDLLELRTSSGGYVIYGTGELIAPGIALTAGHVAIGSSASTPMSGFTVDSTGLAGNNDSLSKGYAVGSAATDPVYASDATANTSYNPLDDVGIVFLNQTPNVTSYIGLNTQQVSGRAITIAGYPCDNYKSYDVAESWKSTGNTISDANGNADGLYLSGITPNSGIGTWYVGGSIIFGGVSGSPIFDSSNRQIGVFDGYYTSIASA